MKPKPSFLPVCRKSPQNEASRGLTPPQQSGLKFKSRLKHKLPCPWDVELDLRSLLTRTICGSVMDSSCSQPDFRPSQQDHVPPPHGSSLGSSCLSPLLEISASS